MPATAGRVRMPANNRVHSSAALQTHGIWQSAIGYDPYAPEKDSRVKSSDKPDAEGGAAAEENAYASFQGLLALARITGSNTDDTRGACKKCGRIGHLTYQCRNFLSVKEDKEKDEAAIQNATAVLDKIKKVNGLTKDEEEESGDEEEEECESPDSDADSEIERIIAARSGRRNRKKTEVGDDGLRGRRGRSKKRCGKRRSLGSDDEDEEERRKEKRHRRRYASSDDESNQEDGHHHHRRKSRKQRKSRSHCCRRDVSDDESEEDSDRRLHHHKRRSRRREASESEVESSSSGHRKCSDRQKKRHHVTSGSDVGKLSRRNRERRGYSSGSDVGKLSRRNRERRGYSSGSEVYDSHIVRTKKCSEKRDKEHGDI